MDLPREDALFREAWLARTVQQCQLMIDENAPPEGCETMARAVQDLAAREAPAWRSDWLSRALVRAKNATVNSAALYADYSAWHKSEGDGQPQSRIEPLQRRSAIFAALAALADCQKTRTADAPRRPFGTVGNWTHQNSAMAPMVPLSPEGDALCHLVSTEAQRCHY